MRASFLSESSCKETHIKAFNPQAWLQVERGRLSKCSTQSSSSIESFIKVPEPPILPFFKPVDYVEILSQTHEELGQCPSIAKSNLYLLQYHVFKGLGEVKLMRRILHTIWMKARTVHEKIIFGAWLKYEKLGEELVFGLLSNFGTTREYGPSDIAYEMPADFSMSSAESVGVSLDRLSKIVSFRIGDEKIECDRQRIANLSPPFSAMLNGCFIESQLDDIDLSENNISPQGMKVVREFSLTGELRDLSSTLLLEILAFSNKFCCERLKDACDRKLGSSITSREDAIELMDYALQENYPVVAASCLQMFLQELPDSLNDERVMHILGNANQQSRSIMAGSASFSLYSLLSEVAVNLDPRSDKTVTFLERKLESAETNFQKQLACHQLGCARFSRKEYEKAEEQFKNALSLGHVYSIVGLARICHINGQKLSAYNKLSSVISSECRLGWMYQERSLYCDGDQKWADLETATELDPTLTYPYMYRALFLMKKQNVEASLKEVNRVLGFKMALECLELRFCFYIVLENYEAALYDIQVISTLSPDYRMFEGKVATSQLRTLVREHVPNWTAADCWLQLYDRWSSVDDIGSLSVIYQMLESDAAKGVLYFRQSLLLLRLNCPEAAMRSLWLAREHASADYERLVYEGWILYDSGHCEEGLQKAEESILLKRSFEAFFLKAYALADSSQDPACSLSVISLLEEALKCPSDRLRKGQALNNLGSVYVDCGNLDKAEECYMNALTIKHTRAHQGLARVHFLRHDKTAAYKEMTELINKAQNNASAYEKRSEYGEREHAKSDLDMVTRLDPFRIYPYRYRAAVLMDNLKHEEAIEELSRAITFKADLHLLHLRAAFHEHIGDVAGALRDCRASLSVDPNHQEMLELHTRVHSQEP